MKLRTLAALAVATTAVSLAAPAAAQKMTGLRFETGGSLSGATQGDLRVGYDLKGGLTPLIGLTFRNDSRSLFDKDDKELGSRGETSFIINLEGRYYFRAHKKGVSPFVFAGVDVNTFSFGTEDGDGKAINEDEDEADGDAASNWGLNAGFGLEYLFSKGFGVGGKWGLNMNFRNSDFTDKTTPNRPGTSNTNWGTASSMYLVWRI